MFEIKIGRFEAIMAINPNARVGISKSPDGKEHLVDWRDTPPIPLDVLDAKVIELKAEYDNQEYARKRKAEYPHWDKQLEKIYDDGIEAWKAEMIDPIKAKYPKPD